jgi:hypothetical protein
MATITEPTPSGMATPDLVPTPDSLPEGVPTSAYYRLSLEQYHAMRERGLLTSGDRVELLAGMLITKITKNPSHIRSTMSLNRFVGRLLPDGWCFGTETPLALPQEVLGRDSEPEPDFTIMRGDPNDY